MGIAKSKIFDNLSTRFSKIPVEVRLHRPLPKKKRDDYENYYGEDNVDSKRYLHEDTHLRWLLEACASGIPFRSDDFYILRNNKWVPLTEEGLHMNYCILRDHLNGKRVLGYKKNARSTNILHIKVRVTQDSKAIHSLLRRIHGEYGVCEQETPSMMFHEENAYHLYYGLNQHCDIELLKKNVRELIFGEISVDDVKICANTEEVTAIPLNYKCQLLDKDLNTYYPKSKWSQLEIARENYFVFKSLDSVIPVHHRPNLGNQTNSDDFEEMTKDEKKSTKEFFKKKVRRGKDIDRYRSLGKESLWGIQYFPSPHELRLVENYIVRSDEFNSMPKHKDLSIQRTRLNAVRDCLIAYSYFYDQARRNEKSETYWLPHNVLRSYNHRYAHAIKHVFVPLFTSVLSNYCNGMWKRHCRGYSLKDFMIKREKVLEPSTPKNAFYQSLSHMDKQVLIHYSKQSLNQSSNQIPNYSNNSYLDNLYMNSLDHTLSINKSNSCNYLINYSQGPYSFISCKIRLDQMVGRSKGKSWEKYWEEYEREPGKFEMIFYTWYTKKQKRRMKFRLPLRDRRNYTKLNAKKSSTGGLCVGGGEGGKAS